MSTAFINKATLLTVFYLAFWSLIGLIVDGTSGMIVIAFALGPVFGMASILLTAYDNHQLNCCSNITS